MAPRSRRFAVLGARSVGKSSLTLRFAEGQFPTSYNPTIEDTFQKSIRYRGQDYNIEIFDTAGLDEFSVLPERYCVGFHGYVLVYSVTSRVSFEYAVVIREKLLNKVGFNDVALVLVGNKADLADQRTVSQEEGRALARSWGAYFTESSAKMNQSVKEIFESIIDRVDRDTLPKDSKGESDCCIL